MSKIIILSRVSSGIQHIESQTNELINAAIRLGYPKEKHIIIESIESAIKLSESERIGLQQLKRNIENDKEVDCVICWEPSRLSRQQATLYSIRDYLLNNRIQLYILNPYMKLLNDDRTQIDTTASIVFSLFATISENEMMIKKERFMRAKNELTKQGKKATGATMFGYIKNKDKKCVPHPVNSNIVSSIFNHYATHKDASLWETYQYASRNWPDIFPMVDYVKGQHRIMHIFENDVYATGNWCYPPIISEELLKQVRERMSKARCKPRFKSKLELLGRGKVRCKVCGKIMTGIGGNVKGYLCSTDKLHSIQINYNVMDWLIWEEVKGAINIAASIDNSAKVLEIGRQISEKENIIGQIEGYLEGLNERQDKLVALYLDDKIDKSIYERRYADLNDEINDKTKELEMTKVQITELNNILHDDNIGAKQVNVDSIDDFNIKLDFVREYLRDALVWKNNDSTIGIEFRWLKGLVLARSIYRYYYKGGKKMIHRINEDGTEDRIL